MMMMTQISFPQQISFHSQERRRRASCCCSINVSSISDVNENENVN